MTIAKLDAIFILGNMGTGKSYWINQAAFSQRGFWIYDVDRYLFQIARKEGISSYHEAIYAQTEANFERFFKAVKVAQFFLKTQIDQCNSVIIESTGNNLPYLLELEAMFTDKPYSIHFYIFHSSLGRKLQNNQARRLLGKNAPPDDIISAKELINRENMDVIRKTRPNVFEFHLDQPPFSPLSRTEALASLLRPLSIEKTEQQRNALLVLDALKDATDRKLRQEIARHQTSTREIYAP